MVRLLPHSIAPELGDLTGISAVELQLVDDGLAEDFDFTVKKGRPRADKPGVYTWTSLASVLASEQLAHIREVVRRVLSGLAEGLPFLCFLAGENVPAGSVEELTIELAIRSDCDDSRLSGAVSLFQLDADDIALGLACWGHFDSLRGMALKDGSSSVSQVLAGLKLAEPIPSSDSGLVFQPPSIATLRGVLQHGSFFFEEIRNGTRLRITSAVFSQQELASRVTSSI